MLDGSVPAMASGTPNNGVNLAPVGELVEAVKANSAIARVTFKAASRWQGGCTAAVAIGEILSDGQPATPAGRGFALVVDEPAMLGGADAAPNPVEYLAAGLCGCLTAGIATNAALFGVALAKLEVEVELDYDVIGLLGIDKTVPTNATALRYTVRLKGADGVTRAQLERCKQVIDGKSPVLNTLLKALPSSTTVIVED